MDKTIAITVDDVSLAYKNINTYSFKSFFKKNINDNKVKNAIENVSIEVEQGEILGVIGKNGSGKSTLLKLLVGVFRQDKGKIDLHGNSISLAAIGVGFLGKLSGRENIMLSGMLLGFSEEQLLKRQAEIIEFADIGDYIDKPVKTYSSGMYSRLAFSITAILETDIILIDEVLSVGDQSFRKKSYAKMLEIIKDKRQTVILVSHNKAMVEQLCHRVVWLHEGQIKMMGESKEVLAAYTDFMK